MSRFPGFSQDKSSFVVLDTHYQEGGIGGGLDVAEAGLPAAGCGASPYIVFVKTPCGDLAAITGLTAAPEPSTWAMLAAGFAGLGLIGGRRVGKPRATG